MTITIYGAGAIGGCVGAYMAQAGEDVLFVDKMAEHVEAINATGMRITGFDTRQVHARACAPDELRGPLGLVFLAVKSQDTEAALDTIVPLAGPDTIVVSLQNGMNAPRIAARMGAQRVVAGFVSFPADWQGPGHIEHGGAGSIWVGEMDGRITARLARIRQLLAHAVNAQVTDNISGYLWAKQIDCALLFAQAVTNETFADVFGNPRYQPVLIALVGEGVGVALAAGVRLQVFDALDLLKLRPGTDAEAAEAVAVLDRFADFWRPRVKQRSGPWRDLAVRKRATEVDYMVGWVIAEGRCRGMILALNEHLVRQVKEIERGERAQGLHNLDELDRHRREILSRSQG